MSTGKGIRTLIDDYADGCLSEEESRDLLDRLQADESDEIREQLVFSTVVERLLRAWGGGATPAKRIVEHVKKECRDVVAERGSKRSAGRIFVRGGAFRGVQVRAGPVMRGEARPARSSRFRGLAFVAVALCVVLGALVWHGQVRRSVGVRSQGRRAERKGVVKSTKAGLPVHGTNDTRPGGTPPQDDGRETEHRSDGHVLTRFFPLEPPSMPAVDVPSPPRGKGENEPGFVPPPDEWTAAAREGRNALPDLGSSPTMQPKVPRPPVLCVKVSHGGLHEWGVTPGDVPSLLNAMAESLDIRYGTLVKPLEGIDPDPGGNPILFFTGHYHFVLTHSQRCLLRRFILGGGMLILNAGLGSKPFYDSARRELRMILPELPLERLGKDHPIFHSTYDLDEVAYCDGVRNAGYEEAGPWLEGITLSCRTAVVVSRWGMAAGWEGKESDDFRAYRCADARRLGINLLSYGASVRAWAKRASHLATFTERVTTAAGTMFVAQLVHAGEWRTRYAGLTMLLHTFNRRTEVPVRLGVKPMKLTDPALFNVPLLYVTGHESLVLTGEERDCLKRYLSNGGFLFAEACCGRKGFDRDFRILMDSIFPDTPLVAIPLNASVFQEPNKIELLGVTPALGAKRGYMLIPPRLEGVKVVGNYAVIYSPYGLAGGWEMSQTPFADGYEDPDALKLGQNILMYAITQ